LSFCLLPVHPQAKGAELRTGEFKGRISFRYAEVILLPLKRLLYIAFTSRKRKELFMKEKSAALVKLGFEIHERKRGRKNKIFLLIPKQKAFNPELLKGVGVRVIHLVYLVRNVGEAHYLTEVVLALNGVRFKAKKSLSLTEIKSRLLQFAAKEPALANKKLTVQRLGRGYLAKISGDDNTLSYSIATAIFKSLERIYKIPGITEVESDFSFIWIEKGWERELFNLLRSAKAK